VPLEATPDPTFGHIQAFDLARLAGLGAAPESQETWSPTVYVADGGWLVLDRHTARLARQSLS